MSACSCVRCALSACGTAAVAALPAHAAAVLDDDCALVQPRASASHPRCCCVLRPSPLLSSGAMPLIVMVGHPCSGKTRRAKELAAHFSAAGLDVTVVNHESLNLARASMYATNDSEKKGRSALKSTLERFLSPSPHKLLIFDYLNSIKGYRYEAWCRAREMQTQHCTVRWPQRTPLVMSDVNGGWAMSNT